VTGLQQVAAAALRELAAAADAAVLEVAVAVDERRQAAEARLGVGYLGGEADPVLSDEEFLAWLDRYAEVRELAVAAGRVLAGWPADRAVAR
jgi:hypothetical protein